MAQTEYDNGRKILDLMKEFLGEKGLEIRTFVYGDPGTTIAKSQKPIVIVDPTLSDYDFARTGSDDNRENYTIRLIIDKRDGFLNDDDGSFSIERLKRLVEKKTYDSDTNKITLDEDSIMGFLRTKVTLNGKSIIQRTSAVYSTAEYEATEYTVADVQCFLNTDIFIENRA